MPRPKHDAQLVAPEWDPARPKGEQIHDILLDFVRSSPAGTLLPSERVLSERLGVARMTVRQCVQSLHDAGLVSRLPGRGTFTREPRVIHSDIFRSFSEDMELRGMRPGSRNVSMRTASASRHLAEKLGLEPGDRVYRIERIRTADDVPMALERTNLSVERFPGLEKLLSDNASLQKVLTERYGVRLDSSEQRINIATLTDREAEALEVSAGTAAFRIEALTRDAMGRPVEFGRSLYRADRYEVVLHVNRPEPHR